MVLSLDLKINFSDLFQKVKNVNSSRHFNVRMEAEKKNVNIYLQ